MVAVIRKTAFWSKVVASIPRTWPQRKAGLKALGESGAKNPSEIPGMMRSHGEQNSQTARASRCTCYEKSFTLYERMKVVYTRPRFWNQI